MTDWLQIYRALPESDRQAILATALLHEPFHLDELQLLLKQLGWRDALGHPLHARFDADGLSRLVDAGCWVKHHVMFRCRPDLIGALTDEARERGLIAPVVAAARAALPRPGPPPGPGENLSRELRREFRFAALLGEEATVFRLLKLKGPKFADADPKVAAAVEELYGEALERASPELQYLALEPILTQGELELRDERVRYDRFEALFGGAKYTAREPIWALASHRLMRGRLDALEALEREADEGLGLRPFRGAILFFRGDDLGALDAFDEGIETLKQIGGKHNLALPGFLGVLHLLALLREGSDHSASRLSSQLITFQEGIGAEKFLAFCVLIQKTQVVLRGKEPLDQTHYPFVLQPDFGPWFELLQSLCLHWLGEVPGAERLQRILALRRQAAQGGYLWFAREAALLLRAWGDLGDYRSDIAAFEGVPLTRLQGRVAPWEQALRALDWLAPRVSATTARVGQEAGDSRLVWQLILRERMIPVLAPRQQTRKGTGWTKGRRVEISQLYRDQLISPYLTAEDRAICACIKQSRSVWGDGFVIEFDSLCAIRAAAGHPRLLLDDRPVRLTLDSPRLLVTHTEGGAHVALYPPLTSQQPFATLVEGDQVRFVEYSPDHIQVAAVLGPHGIDIPRTAQERLLGTLARISPVIAVHSDIGAEMGGEAERVEADFRLFLQMQPVGNGLRIACRAKPLGGDGPHLSPGEGATAIFGQIGGRRLHCIRNLEAERRIAERVFAQCPGLDANAWDWTVDDPELALEALEGFHAVGDDLVLEWPQGKPIRLARVQELINLQIRSSGQDWFAVSGDIALDDGRVMNMARLMELMDAASGRFIKLGEEEFLSLDQALRRRLDAIRAAQYRGRIHSLAAGLLEEALEGVKIKADKRWRELVKRLAEANELQPEVPTTLQAELREYQGEGFRWLARLAHWGAGACLADDMGLGKTIQTLALLLARAAEGPALALAPTSVCANWMEEARRFAPTLNPKTFGPGDRAAMLESAGPFDLIVCSYGLLQSEAESLAKVKWHTIVADEAQAFKNAQTKRSQAIMALSGEFRLITTGTPIENHLGELWNLFRFINPGLLGSHEHFNQRYANPIEQRQDKEAGRQLKRLIRPFILRRLKSDVLSELPERTEITIHVELSDEERVFYEALRRTAIERIAQVGGQGPGDARFQVLAEIMRLRRACCNPRLVLPESAISSAKLQAFGEIVEELRANRHKALVFSQFVDHLSLIREWLDEQKISYQYLDGSTPAKKRQEAVQAFQGGQGELFLISLKAGGAGLNLTAADYVIHLDPWWNPAVEDQASDRAHRIGQQRPVTIYRLVARDTIEERIIDLHRTKRDLADSLLEGAEMAARMGVEEMMALLREAG